jgi:ubiquinone/menaquinone biosynthesis C-methylase UbiE
MSTIIRLVPNDDYSESFGFQWNKFAKTQLDSYTGYPITSDRFYRVTRWSKHDLKHSKILEVGSGAGRFTEVAAQTGGELHSIEYSGAVDANYKNNGHFQNLQLYQASLYEMPFQQETFDKVFCLGVLQHTPNVKKSFMALIPPLKKGGEIAVDVYSNNWKSYFYTKYWVRPITKRMKKETLLKLIQSYIPYWFPISSFLLKIPFVGKFLAQCLPICNYSLQYPFMKKQELIDWAILDTFDMLSPEYDQPQTLSTLKMWMEEAGLEILYCGKGDNGYVGLGRKK